MTEEVIDGEITVVEEAALVPTEQSSLAIDLGTLRANNTRDFLIQAAAMAKELDKILDRPGNKLYSMIKGKRYVHVEGWTTLGVMLGVFPTEVRSAPTPNGWEATVELCRATDGRVLGRASAIVTRDEERWSKADEHAIRSMAITRATSKAFRLSFSWIAVLAGYEPTPAEEMINTTSKRAWFERIQSGYGVTQERVIQILKEAGYDQWEGNPLEDMEQAVSKATLPF